MAGRINDEDVKAVRDAVPIDAVVSEYLQLRNAGGGNLKGLCPFHDEKSPSFQVSPSKGLFHCFGCQEGGDTITFVMKVDHLTFSEAVERLAGQVGITLRYEEGGYNPSHQRGERIRLVEAHKIAAQFYVEQLDTSPEADAGRKFLAERGFDQAAAAHFGVGYSPQGWDHLTRHLRGKGFSDKELLLSGLSQEGRRGPIDRFRGRLMWPIRDIGGEVVGFGARKLYEADNGPKYLNTPDTAIYKKSQVLYGIDLAKKDIAKASRAVVVEGYTDVMACHLAGITTAIATCGTAFGSDHIKILRRLLMDNGSARVIFTFDGDSAGQKAALRAFEDDQKFAAETYIAIAPDGMDPCDLRLAKGDEAVADLVEPRTPLFEFALRQIILRYDLETPAGRAAALDEAAPIVARIKNSGAQHEVAVQLAGMLGILDTQFVVKRVAQLARWARDRGGKGPAPAPNGQRPQPTYGAVQTPPAARRSTSATPSSPPSVSCSSSPSSDPSWSPRPSTPTGSTSSPPRPTPPYAWRSWRRAAPTTARRTPRSIWSGSARPPRTTWSVPWSPSWPSRRSCARPSTRPTRATSSSWSAAVPSSAASWTSRAPWPARAPTATRPSWRPCRTSCGCSSSTVRRCASGARRRSEAALPGPRPGLPGWARRTCQSRTPFNRFRAR